MIVRLSTHIKPLKASKKKKMLLRYYWVCRRKIRIPDGKNYYSLRITVLSSLQAVNRMKLAKD